MNEKLGIIVRASLLGVSSLCVAAAAWAQAPAGIVWTPGEALLVRQGTELPVRLEEGELLFPGDSIDVKRGPVTFAECGAKQEITLAGPAIVKVVSAGQCLLPAKESRNASRMS